MADRPRDLVTALLAAAAAALVFLLVRGSLIDDAYITLSYARNLAEDLHWGLTPYHTANSATSPLNVLVLGAATFLVRDAVWGLGLVLVGLTAAQGWLLSRLGRVLGLGPAAAPLGVLLLLLSPLMLSVTGMEMTLAAALLVGLALATAEGRPVAFGLVTAGLALTRLDLLIFPLVLLVAARAVRRHLIRVVLVAAAASAPWFLFSWLALGALVPDTLVLKTVSSAAWGPWAFANGPLLYWERYPAATALAAVPPALGVLTLAARGLGWCLGRLRRRPETGVGAWSRADLGPVPALGIAGLLHYAAYSLLAPPPYHWYYAPSVIALTLLAVVTGAALVGDARDRADRSSPGTGTGRWAAGAAAAIAVLMVTVDIGFAVQRPLPWDRAPITTNWATPDQYRMVGEEVAARTRGQVVRSPGEIGTLAYYCRCNIVDPFSDPGTLQPLIAERLEQSGPLLRLFLELNFAKRGSSGAAVADWHLEWVAEPAAGLPAWEVDSDWRGPGAFQLLRPDRRGQE